MKEIVIRPLKGKFSLLLLFPSDFISGLEISDGDLMKCSIDDDRIIIKKLVRLSSDTQDMSNDNDIQSDNDIHYYHEQG